MANAVLPRLFPVLALALLACGGSDDDGNADVTISKGGAGQGGKAQGGSGGSSAEQSGQGGSSQAGSSQAGSSQAGSSGSSQAGGGGSSQAGGGGSSQAGGGGSSQAGQGGAAGSPAGAGGSSGSGGSAGQPSGGASGQGGSAGAGGGAPDDPCAGAKDGPACGQDLPGGLADQLYTCQGSKTAAKTGCAGGCASGACKQASNDPCLSAAFGDGAYCGLSLGSGEAGTLYNCQGKKTASATPCPSGCQQNPPGVADACALASADPCKAASSGNGAYCGASLGKPDDPTLYDCQDQAAASKTPCPSGCQVNPPGQADACKSGSSSDPCAGATVGNGTYCGEGLPGGDAGSLYTCKDKTTSSKVACPGGCQQNDPGVPDACKPPAGQGGFGFPVGDKTSWPAGGWEMEQVLGHYLDYNGFTGVHLAEDIAAKGGESATALAPVYAVADGLVRYAGTNKSTYVHVVLIEHALPSGEKVCSFYGHLEAPSVTTGQTVTRGQEIAHVLDWNAKFGYANSHLHYVLLSAALCDASAKASGALVCGYDDIGPIGITDLSNEPATYTSKNDICGDHSYPSAFIAPSKFIQANHF